MRVKHIRVRDLFYRSLIAGITLLFLYSIIWGEGGVFRSHEIQAQIVEESSNVTALQSELKTLETAVANWETVPFFLEKMAREELGMGHKNETVYVYRS